MTSERPNRTSRGSGRDGPGGRPGAGSGGWSAGTMFGPAPEGFAAASGRSSTTPRAADGRRRRFFRRSEAARENSLNDFVVSLRTSAGMVWNGVGAVGVPQICFCRAGRVVSRRLAASRGATLIAGGSRRGELGDAVRGRRVWSSATPRRSSGRRRRRRPSRPARRPGAAGAVRATRPRGVVRVAGSPRHARPSVRDAGRRRRRRRRPTHVRDGVRLRRRRRTRRVDSPRSAAPREPGPRAVDGRAGGGARRDDRRLRGSRARARPRNPPPTTSPRCALSPRPESVTSRL